MDYPDKFDLIQVTIYKESGKKTHFYSSHKIVALAQPYKGSKLVS